ncbi:hypothetical protein TOREUM_20580 [Tenacibaculum litoreum]|uniref:hypothetical protein n=1 Tax=Tenacibaculum litoreum TaxID=321269 RepID=UPI0038957082
MKKLLIILPLLLFLNCKETQKEAKYEVVQTLYNYITKYHTHILAFPVSPPDPKIESDSLQKILERDKEIIKDTTKIVNSYLEKEGRSVVCIDKKQSPSIGLSKRKIPYITKNFDSLYNDFIKIKGTQALDLTKIKDNRYSVIIPYDDYYPEMSNKGFDKCDMVLTFSRIAFNKEENKAIVIMATNFGRLNGFSALYFLEKEKGEWKIKCREGLSIS